MIQYEIEYQTREHKSINYFDCERRMYHREFGVPDFLWSNRSFPIKWKSPRKGSNEEYYLNKNCEALGY